MLILGLYEHLGDKNFDLVSLYLTQLDGRALFPFYTKKRREEKRKMLIDTRKQ